MDRPSHPIPIADGLSRQAGNFMAQAASFYDLRNFRIGDGKLMVRPGYASLFALTAGSVIGIFPMTASDSGTGYSIALVYITSGTARVDAFLLDGGTNSSSLIGTLWTFGSPLARIPRAIADVANGKLFIAHDEPVLANRRQTGVYDLLTNTISPLVYSDPGMLTPKYRGVIAYLDYLVGWGWGTDAEPDRPEIVRVSLPGQPEEADINHYFVVGKRGDPVLDCRPAGNCLIALKQQEAYPLVGYDRATFGISHQPDRLFGTISSRAAATVGGVLYRWTHAGPRRVSGVGDSEDIGQALNLTGPLPHALANPSDPAGHKYIFTAFDPIAEELTWIMANQWGYTLHLRELPEIKWSYRLYGPGDNSLLLRSAGLYAYTAVEARPQLIFGTGDGHILIEALAYTDYGKVYTPLALTNRFAPAGPDGDVLFTTLTLTVRRFADPLSVTVTPVVDGVELPAITKTMTGAPIADGTQHTLLFDLSQAYMVDGIEQTRYYPRGASIQFRIVPDAKTCELGVTAVEHEVVQSAWVSAA
jgi:hypothetical protein